VVSVKTLTVSGVRTAVSGGSRGMGPPMLPKPLTTTIAKARLRPKIDFRRRFSSKGRRKRENVWLGRARGKRRREPDLTLRRRRIILRTDFHIIMIRLDLGRDTKYPTHLVA